MRQKKPLKVLEFSGNAHLTKAAKKQRAEAEAVQATIGEGAVVCPPAVAEDPQAKALWDKYMAINAETEADYLRQSDAEALGEYALLYSQWLDLVRQRQCLKIMRDFDIAESMEFTEAATERYLSKFRAKSLWEKIEYCLSLPAALKLDAAIDTKTGKLIALGDRLFMSPLARLRHTGAKKEKAAKPADPLAQFGL